MESATTLQAEAYDVSLIIPTFHEIEFEKAFERLIAHLRRSPVGRTEILVVDDSTDEERAQLRQVVERRAGDFDVVVLDGLRRGKGAAVREGALRSRGDVVFLLDADLLVPFDELNAFLRRIRAGADVVIGERARDRYRGKHVRTVVSRALFVIQTTLVFHARRFEDTQCGFKAFRGPLLRRLARLQVVDGGMYDLEYLYAASLMNKRVERVAVETLPETRPSRINIWKCLRVDPVDIARFKLRGLGGHYR